ncbi:MAG: helix-turn-helix domain-containing protein [Hyphomicrobiaceae bacterium]|nr:helix-turn-helix domain-containing protein [Hyphomicrobiaceae bacterium]
MSAFWKSQNDSLTPHREDAEASTARAAQTPLTQTAKISQHDHHTPPDGDRLLTTTEAADVLRLSNRTLERYRVTGGGPRYIKLGPGKRARVVYRQADLETWLNDGVFGSTAEYG